MRDSSGNCGYCGETFSKRAVVRHLSSCEKRPARKTGAGERFFELFVEGRDSPQYWMVLDVPAGAMLNQLDAFLRRE